MELTDPRLDKLASLIGNSFRVRANHLPVYVDIGGNLSRISSPQHQVIFGRRGSGKSCLLVHFEREVAQKAGILTIYIEADEFKKLGYPDVLIRLLLIITESMPGKRRNWLQRRLRLPPSPLENQESELRQLLDLADDAEVTQASSSSSENTASATAAGVPAAPGFAAKRSASHERTASFTERKLDVLERHLADYKTVLREAFAATGKSMCTVIVDDFYLFRQERQPDIVDYLHRLLRGTDLYLKIGTVRHRTTLLRHDGQPIGVQLSQDIEEIDLDRTFEDVAGTQLFLTSMLDSMAQQVSIDSAAEFVSPAGLEALTLASGGVPRDYLNILVDAVKQATALRLNRVTPTAIYRAASRNSYRTKLLSLREDANWDAERIERVYQDLVSFCLKEEKKTAFLVNQGETLDHETEHEIIQQLMDFKLIHVIESDTSAASGRTGRYEAYTLDFSVFMEPRRRGITHVRFWKTDEGRRREGVREAPVYSLQRARTVLNSDDGQPTTTEAVLEAIETETRDSSNGGPGAPGSDGETLEGAQ